MDLRAAADDRHRIAVLVGNARNTLPTNRPLIAPNIWGATVQFLTPALSADSDRWPLRDGRHAL